MENKELKNKLVRIGDDIKDFERYYILQEMRELIKTQDKDNLLKALNSAIKEVAEESIECGICPECGGKLVGITTSYEKETNYYHGYLKCNRCGFEVEE